MEKIFATTLSEGAEAATRNVGLSTSLSTTASDSSTFLIIQSIGILLTIIMAIAFAASVKAKIKRKMDFSGMAWGIANGILGIGIIWVIIAHSSINKEIAKIRDKKYKKYVESQMKEFVTTYSVCLVVSITIMIIVSIVSR